MGPSSSFFHLSPVTDSPSHGNRSGKNCPPFTVCSPSFPLQPQFCCSSSSSLSSPSLLFAALACDRSRCPRNAFAISSCPSSPCRPRCWFSVRLPVPLPVSAFFVGFMAVRRIYGVCFLGHLMVGVLLISMDVCEWVIGMRVCFVAVLANALSKTFPMACFQMILRRERREVVCIVPISRPPRFV